MPATIFNTTSASAVEFGLVNETSLILTSMSVQIQPKKSEIIDAEGEVCAIAYTQTKGSIKMEGYINGSVSMAVATIATLTNVTDGYGFDGGTIFIDDISVTSGQGEFKKLSCQLTQYGGTFTERTA